MTVQEKRLDARTMLRRFREHLWKPPRRHGEVIEDRSVSFLELFYDLVFVVLIGHAAHTLAHNISWRGFGEFVIVFGLIWIAWLNGTFYQEAHGREDGRSRTFIFLQMLILAVLAVYTGKATGSDGASFALTYAALFLVHSWLWRTVQIQNDGEFSTITDRYLLGMVLSTVLMALSATLTSEVRTFVWAALVIGWMVGVFLLTRTPDAEESTGLMTTDSLVERFGLFTIIVLGEVVVGVVGGMSEAARDPLTVATGVIGLTIGFGFWWTYFDFVGRRPPREDRHGTMQWLLGHFPVALAIAASGAAMVSLVEHAAEPRAPVSAAWLLSGSVALLLISLIVTMRTLHDYALKAAFYRPLAIAMFIGALSALAVGWWRPAPWALALALSIIHSVVWIYAVDRWLRSQDSAIGPVAKA